jgi:hypothetical protein
LASWRNMGWTAWGHSPYYQSASIEMHHFAWRRRRFNITDVWHPASFLGYFPNPFDSNASQHIQFDSNASQHIHIGPAFFISLVFFLSWSPKRKSLPYSYLSFFLVPIAETEELTLLKKLKNKIHLGICIALTQPFWAALGAESRVCYPGNTADRQTQWALTYYHLSQSTANQNGQLINCHRWDSNLWPSGC